MQIKQILHVWFRQFDFVASWHSLLPCYAAFENVASLSLKDCSPPTKQSEKAKQGTIEDTYDLINALV